MSSINQLDQTLNKLCDEVQFDVKWYVKDLQTGESLNRNGDEIGPSASTRKISILMAAMKFVNEGKISLTEEIIPDTKYFGTHSGCFQHFLPGFKIPEGSQTFFIAFKDSANNSGLSTSYQGLCNLPTA